MRLSAIRSLVLLGCAFALACSPDSARDGAAPAEDVTRWQATADRVTITRDEWGIPHVRGTSDADAVFGVMYAQAEDDFTRIEQNYLNAMGRLAEAEGESAVFQDLRMKIFIHPDSMRAKYEASPDSLRVLMDAFADGLNFYLHTHPETKPRVITRFEPWMALSFSEGSIGGDIESISLRICERSTRGGTGVGVVNDWFRCNDTASGRPADSALRHLAALELVRMPRNIEPGGSNGFAIAPSRSASGHALLLINPHTSFFFRAEAQMTSEAGLNAYGAMTWGQFFIYQGFNERTGWMHTSTGADAIDEYAETVTEAPIRRHLRVRQRAAQHDLDEQITVPFKSDTGMADAHVHCLPHTSRPDRARGRRQVDCHQAHGRAGEGAHAVVPCAPRQRDFAGFKQTMGLNTNSSNNTVYADADGNIAYFHSNFIPKRDPQFDWERPVDGSNPATEWQGIHSVDESPLIKIRRMAGCRTRTTGRSP